MYPTFTPSIKSQLLQALSDPTYIGAQFTFDHLRAEIDEYKCQEDNQSARHSLIRKITAQRYRELRETWKVLYAESEVPL